MFATILEPAAFAATFEDRLALVQRLGGPYVSSDAREVRRARAVGLQTARMVVEREGEDLVLAVRSAVLDQPDIIAIRTGRLSAASTSSADERRELVDALAAADGRHRMIVAVDAPIAPLSAAEWGQLPAESLMFDPIGDPDGWRAAATLPGDRGLVLGLVPAPGSTDAVEPREVLLWALRYAASLGGRGGARVGFTERPRRRSHPGVAEAIDRTASERSAASLEDLLRLTGASEATLRDELDPRSFSPAAQRLRQRRGG